MRGYRYKKRTQPKRIRAAGFTRPVLDTVMDHPVTEPERRFGPPTGLPTRGEVGVEPTPDEGLRIFR